MLITTSILIALTQQAGFTPTAETRPVQQSPQSQPAAQVPAATPQQPQRPGETTQPAQPGAPGTTTLPPGILPAFQATSIEAARQPVGVSRARYSVTPRVGPATRAGSDFTSRVSSPVRSLVGVRGMEDNHVLGFGLITGLAGTGDSGALATQLLANTLLAQNINIDPSVLSTANVAVVRVEGTIPAGAKAGQKMDVRVSAIGDAESLYGGSLNLTELTDITGTKVYATASGLVTVGGFSASGDAASVTKNHVTVGTLTGGGEVQRSIETSVVSDHGYIYLDSKNGQGTFGNSVRIAEAVNRLYPGAAIVLPDGSTIRMSVLDGVGEHDVVAYLDRALSQEVETDNLARIVINERTGVIVMGGDVRLRPGVIHHGTIVVTVAETSEVSQPGPLSQGETVEVPRTILDVVENNNPMVLLGGATSLEEVVEVLNVLGATPRDMIAILEAMLDGGLLIADLRRI